MSNVTMLFQPGESVYIVSEGFDTFAHGPYAIVSERKFKHSRVVYVFTNADTKRDFDAHTGQERHRESFRSSRLLRAGDPALAIIRHRIRVAALRHRLENAVIVVASSSERIDAATCGAIESRIADILALAKGEGLSL